MKQGIIFDMDGTLWDSSENVAVSWNIAIEKSGFIKKKLTGADIKSVMGKTMDVIADTLFSELEKAQRMQLLDECCTLENRYLQEHGGVLYPGLEETLCALKKNYLLYIVSNCQKGYIEAFLDHYQFGKYFEDTECYGNNLLPKGDNIRILADRNELDAAVYVGDIQGDYEASKQAGVGFIHAAYGFGKIDAVVPEISGLLELPETVKNYFSNTTKLDEVIRQINHKHVYIQTHNFPDPDAIASAFGLQELLKYRGIASTICYKGKIDRYSTDKLREILEIDLRNIEDLEAVLTEEDEVILVDAQKGNSNIIDMTGDEIICIDHHPVFEKYEYRFTDIRPEVGACASIIGQYFVESGIPIDRRVATALTFGIHMDTGNLSRGTSKLDIEMLYYLYDACDHDIIHMLENSALYFEDLIAYSKAISSIEVYDNISFANTGQDCPEALIASVSDFMLALVEVTFSIVYSRQKEGIKLSVRSERPYLDAGKIISTALKGIGNGGGHASMAGGFVPFSGTEYEAELIFKEIQERFMSVIGREKLEKAEKGNIYKRNS